MAVLGIARSNLQKDGYCSPVAITYGAGMFQSGIHPLRFGTDAEKEGLQHRLKTIVRLSQADAVLLLMETWVRPTGLAKLPSMPEEVQEMFPDEKSEALIIECSARGGEKLMLMQEFRKESGQYIFREPKDMTEIPGFSWFSNWSDDVWKPYEKEMN